MPGALQHDLGRADEPEEGQIQTMGQKTAVHHAKQRFTHLFCHRKRLGAF